MLLYCERLIMDLTNKPANPTINDDFFHRFNSLFQILGISQNEFSRRIGSTSAFISNIARAKTKPGLDVLQKIATTFDISLDWLLLGKGSVYGNISSIDIEWFHTVRLRFELAKLFKTGNHEAEKLIDELINYTLNQHNNSETRRQLIEQLTRLTIDDQSIVSLYNQFVNGSDEQQKSKDVLIESIKLLGVYSQDPLAQLINHSNAEVIGNVETKNVKQKNIGHFNKNIAGNYNAKE